MSLTAAFAWRNHNFDKVGHSEMAFSTHIQQVLAYLKAGHPILPQGALPAAGGPVATPIVPNSNPGAPRGTMPTANPPKGGM